MQAGKRSRKSNSALLRFLGYVRPHWRLIAGGSLMGIFKFTMPLLFPLAFKYIVDVVLLPAHKLERINRTIDDWCVAIAGALRLPNDSSGKLEALCAALVALFLLQALSTYYRNYWASLAGQRLIFDLRYALYLHMQRLSHSFFDMNPSGAIVARFINDISLAQNFVGSALTNIWMDGASLGFVIWILFALNPRLAWISLCVVPFYVGVIRVLSPRIKAATHDLQEEYEEFSGELQERIAGIGTVKSFAREEHEARRFHRRTERIHDLTIENVRLASLHQMFSEFITRVAPLGVIWAASLIILRGGMQLGTMVAFYAYLGALYLPLQRFSELSIVVSTSLAAIERIFTFFDVTPEVVDRLGSRPLKLGRAIVELDQVSFGYPARDGAEPRAVVHSVTLRVEPGTTVALVGRSGAGKTTLASLIPRFYDATSGRVLIDHIDVRDVTLRSLRDLIGIVPQDSVLFSATVRENLHYGRPGANEAALWQALEQANIREFVDRLPDKLDTVIGERGVKLSGGQKQRVALARVFLKDPPILILDEATSALDSEVENLIHEAMRRLMRGRTSFLIAHRLSTAVEADLIVVLDRGRLVEVGTHSGLLKAGATYAQLFKEQTRSLALAPEHTTRRPGALILAERKESSG
jgi:ABC-type multidrug transport system fused ATPase/permease subunit